MKYLVTAALFILTTSAWAQDFDLVIKNGRVIDPETKLDALRNIGIRDGRIAIVTDVKISGAETINASGYVVAPGFIDFHWHGQDPFGIKLALRGGVTSPLELEVGAYPVEDFYKAKEGKSQANYGASASHLGVRLAILDKVAVGGPGLVLYSDAVNESAQGGSKWSTMRTTAASPERQQIVSSIEDEMRAGALGIGLPVGYATEVSSEELTDIAGMANRYDSFILTHVRYLSQTPPSGYLGLQELMTVAQVNDVPLIVQHVPSNCLALTGECLDLINRARENGMKIAAEFYPWEKGSAIIGADYLGEGFQEHTGMDYSDLLIVSTNETLNEETYNKYRAEMPGETMIMHHIKNEDMMKAFVDPLAFVGSDAFPFIDSSGSPLPWSAEYNLAQGHPRGAGTSGKILRLARETGAITLMDAIAKMTYYPAQFIEDMVPDMRHRGRIQPGMIADIVIFDPETVTDNATYKPGENALPTTGIPYVIVNGTVVVEKSKVLEGVYPGLPIRNPVID